MAVKCLVIGAINGKFTEVLERIAKLNSKKAFDIVIIVGDLFDEEYARDDTKASILKNLLGGNLKIPVPTYFTLGKTAFPPALVQRLLENHDEICENLHFLGKRTTIKTCEGVRIVALGGTLCDSDRLKSVSEEQYSPMYSIADARALSGADAADILITAEWPRGILRGSNATAQYDIAGQEIASELCVALKPRYHFTASNSYTEREPFIHPRPNDEASDGHNVTRFISLAPYDNVSKQKWIYAFNLDPGDAKSVVIPPGATPSPFLSNNKRVASPSSAVETFSRFSKNATDMRPPKRIKHRQPPPGPDSCFFCLSNPNTAIHLVTSIGNEAYMTVAKGPLSTASTFSRYGLDCPGHLLIIPLPHVPTLGAIKEQDLRTSTMAEMQRFRSSVHSALLATARGQLGIVSWEVSRAEGIHTHWQVLPLPVELVYKGLVEAAFRVEAEHNGYPEFDSAKTGQEEGDDEAGNGTGDYFRVWIVGDHTQAKGEETGPVTLTLALGPEFKFDLQFGRRVLAKLLGLEKRFNWRECEQSEQEEIVDAEAWKTVFKRFDFSLE